MIEISASRRGVKDWILLFALDSLLTCTILLFWYFKHSVCQLCSTIWSSGQLSKMNTSFSNEQASDPIEYKRLPITPNAAAAPSVSKSRLEEAVQALKLSTREENEEWGVYESYQSYRASRKYVAMPFCWSFEHPNSYLSVWSSIIATHLGAYLFVCQLCWNRWDT